MGREGKGKSSGFSQKGSQNWGGEQQSRATKKGLLRRTEIHEKPQDRLKGLIIELFYNVFGVGVM